MGDVRTITISGRRGAGKTAAAIGAIARAATDGRVDALWLTEMPSIYADILTETASRLGMGVNRRPFEVALNLPSGLSAVVRFHSPGKYFSTGFVPTMVIADPWCPKAAMLIESIASLTKRLFVVRVTDAPLAVTSLAELELLRGEPGAPVLDLEDLPNGALIGIIRDLAAQLIVHHGRPDPRRSADPGHEQDDTHRILTRLLDPAR